MSISLNDILNEIKLFYKNIYNSKSPENNQNTIDFITQNIHTTLNNDQKICLDEDLTESEITSVIKNMKRNKSPGSDGFTIEFYQFFWSDIKQHLIRAYNHAFQVNKLSISQRRGIITCIPKANKDRTYMKKWRPITLLNTDYKILSNILANRLKNCLPHLIKSDQKGFMKGRFIGENTRLVYDIMQYLEVHKMPGLLLLIYFEKAFDSVEWKFI